MNILEEDIRRGSFRRGYLLCGEEEYLKEYYAKALVRALIPKEDPINLNRYSGREADPTVLIGQADTLPFFADYRLLLVKSSGLFKKGGDALADYFASIPESTVFLFVENEVDKRSRLYKVLRDKGAVLELNHQKADTLTNWIVRRLAREHKQIQRSALQLLLSRSGDDMYLLSNELNKLTAYTGDREGITLSDVELVCTEQLESKVFKMIDAAAAQEKETAFALYRDLVFLREPSLRILGAITAHFRRLLLVRDLRDQGYDRANLEKRSGLKPFMLRGLMSQAELFDSRRIRNILSSCAQADEAIKTGRMEDRTAVELLLARICQRS